MDYLTPDQREQVGDLLELTRAELLRINPADVDMTMVRIRRCRDNIDSIAALLPRRDARPVEFAA